MFQHVNVDNITIFYIEPLQTRTLAMEINTVACLSTLENVEDSRKNLHLLTHVGGSGLNIPSSEHVVEFDLMSVQCFSQLYCSTSLYIYFSLFGLKAAFTIIGGGGKVTTAK